MDTTRFQIAINVHKQSSLVPKKKKKRKKERKKERWRWGAKERRRRTSNRSEKIHDY